MIPYGTQVPVAARHLQTAVCIYFTNLLYKIEQMSSYKLSMSTEP